VPPVSLYANDVVMFCHPSIDNIMSVKNILQLFGHASGLHVNFMKSLAMLMNCSDMDVTTVWVDLGFPIIEFPIVYQGIPHLLNYEAYHCPTTTIGREDARKITNLEGSLDE
jgi:hypothetical protein